MTTSHLFKWRHFLPEIILLNVRWYCRYALSYRNLEEMMAEPGVEVVLSQEFLATSDLPHSHCAMQQFQRSIQ
jgi:transposase-like protein